MNQTFSQQDIRTFLNTSRTTFRKRTKKLKITGEQDGKEKFYNQIDTTRLIESFKKSFDDFLDWLKLDESERRIEEVNSPILKPQPADGLAVQILENQISELKFEKEELKTELKKERESKESILRENGQLIERADSYRNKFIEAQKLLDPPKTLEKSSSVEITSTKRNFGFILLMMICLILLLVLIAIWRRNYYA